jgi:hypothetical protein
MRRGLAFSLLQARRFAEAAAQYDKLRDITAVEVPWQAEALVALGRAGDAAARVAAVIQREPGGDLPRLYARVAHLAGDAAPHPPDFYLDKDDQLGRAWYACAVAAGEPPAEVLAAVESPDMREALTIASLARRTLEPALERARKASPAVAARLDAPLAILLAGELQRRGDATAAAALLDNLEAIEGSFPAVKAAVLRGESSPEVASMELSVRAALELVQARRAKDPAERRKLVAQARADDVFRGAVADAADHWP